MTSLRKRLSAPKEMFVAVKYSKPYEKYPNDVFSAKCITHLVVGPKPAPGADRPKVPYQHSPGVGFASGMLYVIRTDRDALDNKMHDYYVYIGACSESEEDLRSMLADETRSGELSWPPTIEDTSELESGCESDEKSVRDGRVLNQAINNSKDLRLARQQSHQNHLSALKSNSHLDLSGPNTGILSDPGMTLENLRKQAKEQAEIIKKMEEESQRRKEEDKRRAEELSQKEEALRKKEEELNANIKRIDSVFVCIQNLQSDVSLIKEKISGSSIASGSTSSSLHQEEDIWENYHGLKIRRRVIPGLEEAQKDLDFFKTLLKGCFGKEAKNMRMCHSPGTTKVTEDWQLDAQVVFGHWLTNIKKINGLPLAAREVEARKKTFGKMVGEAARALCPARGVNLVKQEARDKGLSKAEVQAAALAYQAGRPKRPARESDGKGPTNKKATTQVVSVEARVNEGLQLGTGTGPNENWENVDPTLLPSGPSGPEVRPVNSQTVNMF